MTSTEPSISEAPGTGQGGGDHGLLLDVSFGDGHQQAMALIVPGLAISGALVVGRRHAA